MDAWYLLFKCHTICLTDALLCHITDSLSSMKQLCSALGPEMEILWSGTPGAAKKVWIKHFNYKGFVCIKYVRVWLNPVFVFKPLKCIRPCGDKDEFSYTCVWQCLCLPLRWFLQAGEPDQWRSQQSRDKPPHQNQEEAGQHTWHGSQCGEFIQQL